MFIAGSVCAALPRQHARQGCAAAQLPGGRHLQAGIPRKRVGFRARLTAHIRGKEQIFHLT
eukprot:5947325-Pleurochrysis_carterae.AAC.1